jgi:hypothetical protein
VLNDVVKVEEVEKKNDVNHTREGIGHSHQLARQVEGKQRDRKWSEDEKA